jgi:thioredoxin reductase (NADPH)
MGPQMMQDLRDQAERFGSRFITDDATKLELSSEPGGTHVVHVGGKEIRARAVILAMGAEPKKLGVPGEEELSARGVSYCATCDAAFFRDAETIVVGGGDTAMEDATFLAKFAGKVSIVHRRPEFRASAIMLDRAREKDNIELVTPYVVRSFEPGENGSLGHAVLENTQDASTKEIPVTGAFVAIGHEPNSHLVEGQLDLDDEGYVLVEGRSTKTKLPGVFAAGDLTDRVYRQAVTAAGTGCMAALDAEAFLRDHPIVAEAHWAPEPDRVEAAAESAAHSG